MSGPMEAVRNSGALAAASTELERINLDLAALFAREPVELATGANESRGDPLVVCGLLGGKDVGKEQREN